MRMTEFKILAGKADGKIIILKHRINEPVTWNIFHVTGSHGE
jgi:hypothetical protein